MSQNTSYETIVEHAKRIHNLEQIDHLLRWDSDVMMPPQGTTARSGQRETLSKMMHDLRGSDALGRALDRVDEQEMSQDERAIVRETRREHEVTTSVPDKLHGELADVTARAHEAWKSAKQNNDWDTFAPVFKEHIDLRREWANYVDPNSDPYEVLWKNKLGYTSQPYIELSTVNRVFDRLKSTLPSLIEDVQKSDTDLETDVFKIRGPYTREVQKDAFEDVLTELGIDWDRARFDTAPHPFSYGNPYDVRLTTRFDEDDPTSGFTATMHEFGHTTYHHGLPAEQYGTPLGRARGLTIHGSQSGIWENHIGRSEPFWEFVLPIFQNHFPQLSDVTPSEAYEAVNQVNDSNVIRTAADELTYHMHIIIRTEIEQALVGGEMTVNEVPQVWNEKYDQYLGVTPDSYGEGPLQDPHWSGDVPGFINYTLGHGVLAAQVWAAADRDLPLDDQIRRGEFEPLQEWMRENIHRHGQCYKSQELVRRATNREITADHFLAYIEDKYRTLYDC
ncbi:carboxypeptidase M32 [Natronosalvus rutilus]|uniref:Metal-dependent carboxypeptidase n=1 Tax=Natronosalvus rutilus TaxID=2953753 RepID=A0A9E7NCE1_9EURY|nr:carboxypeptidase M32 [Natronosalvus rutilus]UTF55712.1 carboxypeptidase M32 [Natronosalvus rutilus]